ncbi:hypothetical protein [Ruania halotolerans]|uniref:hypothetical protein n=1 Tax=Ruania halotolerans TaxID=2897773 RepID=UPI001E2B2AFC|nr:hypothetical protein [Ruania halotolerans]UFU08245.1 hypothetical protein LQF10_09190 [Ruania halotolerans]
MNTPTSSARLPRRLIGVTALASTVLLGHCLFWLAQPHLNPYADGQLSLLSQAMSLPAYTALLTALALTGAIVAAIGAIVPHRDGAARATAPVVAVGMATATAGLTGLSMAGYLVALALPFVALVVAIVAMIRIPRARAPLGGLLIVGVAAAVIVREPLVGGVSSAGGALLERAGILWIIVLTLTATGLWVASAALAARSSTPGRAATAFVVRFRVPVTVLAALGPLPYAVIRLSWLTPWPIGAHPSGDPSITAWGMLLSLGAWMGSVLTIGLIRPWGERFPEWMPRVGGRIVPPAFAIVPGGIVAGLVCLAAVGWVALAGPLDAYFWILPVWFWGPMLALAVWGYAGHRAVSAEHQPKEPGATPGAPHSLTVPTARMVP